MSEKTFEQRWHQHCEWRAREPYRNGWNNGSFSCWPWFGASSPPKTAEGARLLLLGPTRHPDDAETDYAAMAATIRQRATDRPQVWQAWGVIVWWVAEDGDCKIASYQLCGGEIPERFRCVVDLATIRQAVLESGYKTPINEPDHPLFPVRSQWVSKAKQQMTSQA